MIVCVSVEPCNVRGISSTRAQNSCFFQSRIVFHSLLVMPQLYCDTNTKTEFSRNYTNVNFTRRRTKKAHHASYASAYKDYQMRVGAATKLFSSPKRSPLVVDGRHWADNTYIPLSYVGPDRHTWIARHLAALYTKQVRSGRP